MSGIVEMDEHKFDLVADRWLQTLEHSLGELDPDLCDVSLSMGVMKLEFADGSVFVINSHRAARQIWMAANLHAWHFNYVVDSDRWVCDRTGEDLLALIETQVSSKLELPFRF